MRWFGLGPTRGTVSLACKVVKAWLACAARLFLARLPAPYEMSWFCNKSKSSIGYTADIRCVRSLWLWPPIFDLRTKMPLLGCECLAVSLAAPTLLADELVVGMPECFLVWADYSLFATLFWVWWPPADIIEATSEMLDPTILGWWRCGSSRETFWYIWR